MKRICTVTACYNEVENIPELYKQLLEITSGISDYQWEFLFEDNCSTDGTVDVLRELAKKDSRVKVILNQANYGVARSYSNAICATDADAIIIIAADLEDPPYLIADFVKAWKEDGYKVVFGQYEKRQENMILRVCRNIYYWITRGLSDYKLESNLTGFGLLDRSVVSTIVSLNDPYIHVGNLTAEMKYRIKYIQFNKPHRKKGHSSYSLKKYYRTAMDNIVMSTQALLHTASFFGAIISFASVVVAIYFLIRKLIQWQSFELGLAPLLIGIFFLGGVQLFFIGVIGEYLGNVLTRVTKRPYVLECERLNFGLSDIDGGKKNEGNN